MKAKIYVILKDYDNGDSYEEHQCDYRSFVGLAGTDDAARQIIQDTIIEMQKDDWYDDPGKIDENSISGRVVFMRLGFGVGVIERTEFYIEEKEVEIPD